MYDHKINILVVYI